ncbi:MAG: AAA family ATPase, partial [Brevinematia bacterium]
MKINEIYLKNFRIFDEINVSFKDRNVIIGPNGSGKTTLIEALNYVSVLSPLRTYETDKDLVKVGENYFNILAKFEHDDGVKSTIFVGYEIKDSSTHKKIKLDDKKVNVIDVSGRLKVVPFLIEDYEVVIGAPSWRRKIIDNFLIISNPSYHHNLLNYYKILKQKNMVLKSIDTSDKGINDKSELDEKKELVKVYNTDIAKFAIQITKERYEFFNYILEYMNLHSPIKVDLKYKSQVKIFLEKHQDPVSYYIEFINSEIEKEIAYGKSMIG